MKIVVNKCFGGYSLSPLAVEEYAKACGKECYHYKQTKYSWKEGVYEYTKVTSEDAGNSLGVYSTSKDFGNVINDNSEIWENYLTNYPKDRIDTRLIEVVERLGRDADGSCAALEVVEIPDDVNWEIDEYDGMETVREKSRSW